MYCRLYAKHTPTHTHIYTHIYECNGLTILTYMVRDQIVPQWLSVNWRAENQNSVAAQFKKMEVSKQGPMM
jgi:hypothetical protein